MTSPFTAITKKDCDWWIGWIEEVAGVNAQERSKEELIASLKEVLTEALEFNRSEARQGLPQQERLATLNGIAITQMHTLLAANNVKRLK